MTPFASVVSHLPNCLANRSRVSPEQFSDSATSCLQSGSVTAERSRELSRT